MQPKKIRTTCDDRLNNQKLRRLEKSRAQIASMNPYGNPYFADLDDPYAVQLVQQMNQFNNAWKSAEIPKKGVEKAINVLNSLLNNYNTMMTYTQNAANTSNDELISILGMNVYNLGQLNQNTLLTGAIFNNTNYLDPTYTITLYLPPDFSTPLQYALSTIFTDLIALESANNDLQYTTNADALAAVALLQTAIDHVVAMISGYQGLVNILGEYQNTTGDQRTLLENNFKNWKDDRLCNMDKQIDETKYV